MSRLKANGLWVFCPFPGSRMLTSEASFLYMLLNRLGHHPGPCLLFRIPLTSVGDSPCPAPPGLSTLDC